MESRATRWAHRPAIEGPAGGACPVSDAPDSDSTMRSRLDRRGFVIGFCGTLLAVATFGRGASAEELTDLVLDAQHLAESAVLDTGVFHKPTRGVALDAEAPLTGSCVLHPSERCVGGPGIRKLLRFGVIVDNIGQHDLVIGDPSNQPERFSFSECHGHYHFRAAARYELIGAGDQIVARGHKQGFCIRDNLPNREDAPATARYPDCEYQGITAGWSDWYPAILDCQWIDVTDVAPGDYQIRVAWNTARLIPETNYDNDIASTPFSIPAPTSSPPVVSHLRAGGVAGSPARTGSELEVTWSASDDVGLVTQEISYSTDDGATYRLIVGDLPGDVFHHVFQIPRDGASQQARVRVRARDGEVQKGEAISARLVVGRGRVRLPRR